MRSIVLVSQLSDTLSRTKLCHCTVSVCNRSTLQCGGWKYARDGDADLAALHVGLRAVGQRAREDGEPLAGVAVRVLGPRERQKCLFDTI